MRYYEVWVRSDRFRGSEALTYSAPDELAVGSIVRIPLRSEHVLGFISAEVARPKFATKPVIASLDLPPLPAVSVALAAWLRSFYAAPIGVVTSLFLPGNLSSKAAAVLPQDIPVEAKPSTLSWTPEQQAALDTIQAPNTYLLHGRTGSGKTSIYLELARRAFAQKQSALILTPEIGLTSQLAEAFRESFGQRVFVLHSQLSAAQRRNIWLQILRLEPPAIVIGPRSVLFSPVRNLGLIVVDEAHDGAYKQEQAPYYHAIRVAARLRQATDSILVLGSATPTVSDYHMAAARQKPIIRLQKLAQHGHEHADELSIIDLRDRGHFSRSPHLSDELIRAMAGSLERGEQSLLYLNRRGTARITLCETCGWQAMCPRCDLPLAYHGDSFRLRCHTCGYSQAPVLACPICGSTSIHLKSFGTKAIVDEAQRLFPDARIRRFDTDNTQAERLEHQLTDILNGKVDVLVGTQMLAKGLDLPRLSTLGIILADTSLYLPDYTARERTFQLLSQVMGRVGRGHTASQTLVQTYYPDSSLIQTAINGEWDQFYEQELAERQAYNFPPFCFLLKLSCRRATRTSAERAATALAAKLRQLNLPIIIEGPAPAFHEKVSDGFQWQLIIKARARTNLLKVVEQLPANWSYDLDPTDLL